MSSLNTISRKPLSFVLISTGLLGALVGLFMGMANDNLGIGIIAGAALSIGMSYTSILGSAYEMAIRWGLVVLASLVGFSI